MVPYQGNFGGSAEKKGKEEGKRESEGDNRDEMQRVCGQKDEKGAKRKVTTDVPPRETQTAAQRALWGFEEVV